MKTLRSRLQVELLVRSGRLGRTDSGFTLIELMIVVVIVGVLSAVALPAFLGARDAAVAGAAIGEVVGISKECATAAASDIAIGVTDVTRPGVVPNADFTGGCLGGGEVVITFANLDPAVNGDLPAGLLCLGDVSAAGDAVATITTSPAGALTCLFS